MKHLLLRGLALVAATVVSSGLLSGVASLADKDRVALAHGKALRATVLAAASMEPRR